MRLLFSRGGIDAFGNELENQDLVGETDNMVYVIDGATPKKSLILDDFEKKGANVYWFVRSLAKHVEEKSTSNKSLKEVINEAVLEVSKEFSSMTGRKPEEVEPYLLPSASAVFVRLKDNCFEMCGWGDCKGFIYATDGQSRFILEHLGDMKLRTVDMANLTALKTMLDNGRKLNDAFRTINDLIVVAREKYHNKPDGYWVLTPQVSSSDGGHCKTLCMNFPKGSEVNFGVLLWSDGFDIVFKSLPVNPKIIIETVHNEDDAEKIYKAIREFAMKTDFKTFPRFKILDDLSFVIWRDKIKI